LAGYTHYFGALFAVIAGLVALAATRSRRAVLCVAIIAASPLPWILYHTRYMSAGAELAGWMADFPLAHTADWFVRLWLGDRVTLVALVLLLLAGLAISQFRQAARHDRVLLGTAAITVLTLAAAVAISRRVPVLSARHLLVLLPPLCL